MKIGIIGASGKVGKFILKEAINRGHEVTAIVRNASKVTEEKVHILEKDVFDLTSEYFKSFGQEHLHVEAGNVLIKALKERLMQD